MADRPIVVGVDGSEPSLNALDRALELARAFEVPVHVVTVVHMTAFYQAGLAITLISEPEIEQQISDAAWARVEDRASSNHDVPLVRVDRRGYPPDEIASYADEVQARMVVVGNRGYGPVRSAVLGSTSHRVAQNCSRDVLIVRD